MWEVDIISMSFGFRHHTPDLDCIQEAIKQAYGKNIVMFAAAHNYGGTRQVSYPANQHEVIPIFSADGQGKESSFSPFPVSGLDNFSTLGEALPFFRGRGPDERRSGTSFATPIAAGIAALTMDYIIHMDLAEEDKAYVERVKTLKGMQSVMRLLASNNGRQSSYIAPWHLFCAHRKAQVAPLLIDALKKF